MQLITDFLYGDCFLGITELIHDARCIKTEIKYSRTRENSRKAKKDKTVEVFMLAAAVNAGGGGGGDSYRKETEEEGKGGGRGDQEGSGIHCTSQSLTGLVHRFLGPQTSGW